MGRDKLLFKWCDASIHTFVHRNAHGIKDKLGLVSGQNKKNMFNDGRK